jgi:hypothetical protein
VSDQPSWDEILGTFEQVFAERIANDPSNAARRIYRPSAKKRGGRPRGSLGAKARAIRESVFELQDEYDVMTVRQAFYALTVRGVVEKAEAGYRQVQRQILLMRREGILPWEFIADGTRWVHAPETWDAVEDALQETARTYRRNLWRSQNVRLEFWLEKDALASIISEVTYAYGVRLMVSRGQSSDTYCYSAAQDARTAWEKAGVETYIFTLYDADKSGRIAAKKVTEKLDAYSGDAAPIISEKLAVTENQIFEWTLPTRPAKEKGEPDAVELDAIPPDKLKQLVENAIIELIDPDAWAKEQVAEESEREVLLRMVDAA